MLLLSWVAGPLAVSAVTLDFNAGSGQPLSYTEDGMTVAPVIGTENHVHLGDNDGNTSPDLMLHPGCCSTPYRFTYTGGAFSVAAFDFVLLGGTHTFTASSGAQVSPGSSGTVALPVVGWTGITSFEWHDAGTNFSEQGVIDNLKFCPGDCDDGNACTADSCDPDDAGADGNGCVHVPAAGPCDDGFFCNGADSCSGGGCTVHAGNPCAGGTECADACNETAENCFEPQGTPCTDEGNTCTSDECNATGACVHTTLPDNSSCDDGDSCTTNDLCTTGVCDGTLLPQTCNDNNPCTADTCNPQGGCLFDSAGRNGFACDDSNTCTSSDACSNGVCTGLLVEADTDADGFCDRVENDAGCNIDDAFEIPPRPNTFAGAPGIGPGEVILTYAAPGFKKVPRATDPSCQPVGVCGPVGFCTTGKIWDPCDMNTDCDQPVATCRVVVNYGDVLDLLFVHARVNRTDHPGFIPLTGGCSRKADLTMDPTRLVNRLKLKVKGTVGTRKTRDSDRFQFLQ